jgi:hypothetical protein
MNSRITPGEARSLGSPPPRETSRRRRGSVGTTLSALERRIGELEHIASSQRHDLRIQFERIAQLQAECDVIRIRFDKSMTLSSNGL